MIQSSHTDAAILAELGDRVARIRLNRNITQSALARDAGISKPTLQRLEAGKSTQMSSFLRVLRALGLLPNLEALVPPSVPSPIQQAKMKKARRQRASGSRNTVAEPLAPWTWDDE